MIPSLICSVACRYVVLFVLVLLLGFFYNPKHQGVSAKGVGSNVVKPKKEKMLIHFADIPNATVFFSLSIRKRKAVAK